MKKIIYLFLPLLVIACGKGKQETEQPKTDTVKVEPVAKEAVDPDAKPADLDSLLWVEGNFTGDTAKCVAWMKTPKIISEENMEVEGKPNSTVRFTSKSVPMLELERCLGGRLQNLGDLNYDGRDELGVLYGWWPSDVFDYHVWTFVNDKWQELIPAFSVKVTAWEQKGPNFKPVAPAMMHKLQRTYDVLNVNTDQWEEKVDEVELEDSLMKVKKRGFSR